MEKDRGASAKASVRSSAAAQPASRGACLIRKFTVGPLVFNWNVNWEVPNAPYFRWHGRAGWVYFRRKWSIAWWSMHSPWRGLFHRADRNDSEDRTEVEGEAHIPPPKE